MSSDTATREVQRLRGFFFGHYDSRGGATFIQSDSMYAAINRYVRDVLMPDEQDSEWAYDAALEDLYSLHVDSRCSGPDEIVVFDTEIGEGEALIEYDGTHKWAWVHKHVEYDSGGGYDDHKFLALWSGEEEPEWPKERDERMKSWITYESNHGEDENPGEDAFGLVVML